MHISNLSNSRMQPEDLLIFSLKEHHLLYKIIENHPYIYFLKGEIHVLNLNRISVIRIDSLLIFFASQNWFVKIKTRSTTFVFWPPQDYQPFKIKTTMNASSFVILDCRKNKYNCCLSRLLIGSRAWPKGKSCWSHFIFCKSNLKWKISTRNQNLWLIFWFPLFIFISASIHDLRLRLT